jgi:putative transposase
MPKEGQLGRKRPENILTLAELAGYLHTHPSTIYRLLKNHQLTAFKIGRDWRFNVEQIDQLRFSYGSSGGRMKTSSAGPLQTDSSSPTGLARGHQTGREEFNLVVTEPDKKSSPRRGKSVAPPVFGEPLGRARHAAVKAFDVGQKQGSRGADPDDSKNYQNFDRQEVDRVQSLVEENRRLKKIVADQALDIQRLKEVVARQAHRRG